MKIVIKTTNVRLNQALRQWIKKKFDPLEKFSEIFQDKEKYFFKGGKPRAEIWVEIGRTTFHHKKGDIFRAEAQVRLSGKSLRAEACAKHLRLAVTQVKDELQRQFKRYKNKRKAEMERGSRVYKKTLHLAGSAKFKERKVED